jgi:hypothetical protein
MARAISGVFVYRYAVAILAGGLLGGYLGFASAQEPTGWLDNNCFGTCTANGYDKEFCSQVCWVPDPAKSAEADNVDWKCFESCYKNGGRARPCFASCQRH